MKKKYINEIIAVIVLSVGVILFVSLLTFVPEDLPWFTATPNFPAHNAIRIVGAYLAGSFLFLFGLSSYSLVIFAFFLAWNKFASRELQFSVAKVLALVILLCVMGGLFSLTGPAANAARFERGGIIGFVVADFLVKYLGHVGAYIILLTLATLTMILTGEFLVSPLLFRFLESVQNLPAMFKSKMDEIDFAKKPSRVPAKSAKVKTPKSVPSDFFGKFGNKFSEDKSKTAINPALAGKALGSEPKPRIRITEKPKEVVTERQSVPKSENRREGEYRLPGLDLLKDAPALSTNRLQSDLEKGAQTLEETLLSFNVAARVADVERGPVITRYELEPAPGVKVQKITTLADDIALAMMAHSVRIVAPIPGKNRVGIEVPNSSKAAVYLKDVLSQSQFQGSKHKLMLALGKDISGKPIIANLAEMPHLLIAGTTGAGKTVCVNSLIMSMLFNANPDEVKFLMVDPKMVELAGYNDIPHMLCPAVTDHKKVAAALNWVVGEMESRYTQLSKAGARNIANYHAQGQTMPYIVIIIDELADLMQVAAKTIESAITRLAQLSRAVGIHLILATQRPSVDVITGVIKANFPARVSFKVASKVDSRTVLDMNGAETLLGKGDMLFIKPGDAKPTRGQCSFVSDEEVNQVMNFIKSQQTPEYDDKILQQQKSSSLAGKEAKDDLYDEAVRLVIETNQASVSILQRRMRLGYTRAARLIDMMEQDGLVGPYCGSKPRDILVDREEWLMKNMNMDTQQEEDGSV